MRKLIYSIIASVAILFTACQTADVVNDINTEMVELAIEANTLNVEDDTRVSLNGNKAIWEVGDRITVAFISSGSKVDYANFEIKSSADIATDGKSAILRGSAPAGTYYAISAIYPGVDNGSNSVTLDRNSTDNIYMSSYSSETTTIDNKTTSLPLSFEHLMHKFDVNLSLASDYASDDLAADNISVEINAKSNNSVVSFWETASYNMTRNTLSSATTANTITLATSGKAGAKSISLSTFLFPLGTMRDVVLTFSVYIDGEMCYEIKKPESGTLSTLTMSGGKTTVVNLELSKKNNVNSGLEKRDITLKTSKTTIKANGSDSATLSVVANDNNDDLTSESTIYVNGTKLNGTTFTTTNAGTYTLYAERNEVRSNEITITAEKATTGKTIVFAEGVSLTSGWYDVNKKGSGSNGDTQMCWAASASNMIQWWQDRYVAAGNTLPSTAINGPGTKMYDGFDTPYELKLMEMYHSEWDNSFGGHVEEAIPWYFEGKLNGGEYASPDSQATPKTAGGYWKSVWSSIEPKIYCGYDYFSLDTFATAYTYTVCYNNYNLWGNGSSLEGEARLKYFSDLVVRAFKYGMASLTISLNSNIQTLHHATTLWGYEIDNSTGLITRMCLTDSDDMVKEPKTQKLHEYSVSINEGKSHIKLTGDTRYGSAWIVSLHPFSGYGSADK